MIRRARFTLLLTATLTASLLLASQKAEVPEVAAPHNAQFVSVSLPALPIGARERVVGFNFEVTSGRISQLPDMPIGWSISVNNDPSWNTKVDASVLVAAAALDTSFFKDFAVIEKDKGAERHFALKGKVVSRRIFRTCALFKSG